MVLTLVSSKRPKHGRRCDVARFQRGNEPQDIITMLTADVSADDLSEKGRQVRIVAGRLDRNEMAIREIAHA
ncbi:hypothetical protein ATY29_05700 [Rhizobium hidalgonense]|nr:hypothetical protein ATY29_05700 [Rhizobium hidalgonense]